MGAFYKTFRYLIGFATKTQIVRNVVQIIKLKVPNLQLDIILKFVFFIYNVYIND
jgi:hypothetical protein